MEVVLSWSECEQAAVAGVHRRLLALHDERPAFYGFAEPDTWGSDIESAAAELAVARWLGLYWTPWARRPAQVVADVGDRVQVRRRGPRGHHLLLHDRDPDEHVYVQVAGTIPTFTLVGWCVGRDAKDAEFWGDPYSTGRPCFWVPEDRLEPVESLLLRQLATA